jgi:hypothetical protein
MKKFMPDDDEEIIINNDSVLQRKMDDIGREWREKLEENRQSAKNNETLDNKNLKPPKLNEQSKIAPN